MLEFKFSSFSRSTDKVLDNWNHIKISASVHKSQPQRTDPTAFEILKTPKAANINYINSCRGRSAHHMNTQLHMDTQVSPFRILYTTNYNNPKLSQNYIITKPSHTKKYLI